MPLKQGFARTSNFHSTKVLQLDSITANLTPLAHSSTAFVAILALGLSEPEISAERKERARGKSRLRCGIDTGDEAFVAICKSLLRAQGQ